MRRVRVFLVRLFLCVFFFLSFTHSSSHVLHDFELSSSSFKSKFCLVRPFSFFQERVVRTSKKGCKKKKKGGGGERKRGNQRTLFFEPTLSRCVAHIDRRRSTFSKKRYQKKKRKEGIKGEEAKDRPDRTISPSRRWVKLHHYTRRDVCFHVKPKRDERQRVFFVFEKREQRE